MTVLGGVGPLCGQYNVSLDGSPSTTYNASSSEANSGQVLFYSSGLANAPHTLLLTNLGSSSSSGGPQTSLVVRQIMNMSAITPTVK